MGGHDIHAGSHQIGVPQNNTLGLPVVPDVYISPRGVWAGGVVFGLSAGALSAGHSGP